MKRRRKKIILVFIILLIILLISPLQVSAEERKDDSTGNTISTDQIIDEQAKMSGADKLNNDVPKSAKGDLKNLGINEANSDNLANFTPLNVFNTLIKMLKDSIQSPFSACIGIFAVLLACALLTTLKSSFIENSMQNVFDVVSALCVSTILLIPLTNVVKYCADVIKNSSIFMMSFLPVYSTLAVASGKPASGIVSQSLLMVVSQVLSSLTTTIFVPMVDIYLTFCIVGSIAPNVNIVGIASFIKKVVTWTLTLALTVYTGILTVQGVISAAADNVTIKTAKFVVDGAVPIIGGTISDAVNTVISCTGLLKTSVGAYAIVVFILTYLPPVLQCLLWLLCTDISLAVADILGIKNMSGVLTAINEAIKLLIALVLSSGLAMIISVSVMLLLGKGN